MPYYQGGSLANRIERQGALDEAEALRIGRTLADALEYVHQHGVLHRDIKPSNVLISDVGEPLLCDFGVARLTDASVALHTTGTSVVTWAFGPPEAFTGGEPTPAWDVYSLGATIYTMLTGMPPFVDGENVNIFAVLNRIGNVDAPDLRDRGVSPSVAEAIRRSMAKPPEDRPASAAEFGALLAPRPPAKPVVPVAEAAPVVEAAPVAEPAPVAEVETPPPETPAVVPPRPETAPIAPRPAKPSPVAPAAEPPGVARPGTTLPIAALVLAGIGMVLSIVGAGQHVFYGSDWFDGGRLSDLALWTPLVVLLATGFFLKSAGTAAEWLIGAGAALVFDHAVATALFAYLDIYNKDSVGWTSIGLRGAGAGLVAVAVVLAWGVAAHPGRPIRGTVAAVLLAGSALVFADFQIWSGSYFSEDIYKLVVVAVTIAFLVVVLSRAFALGERTNGAPALVASGLTGSIVSALGLGFTSIFGDNAGSEACGLLGSAAVLAVGIWAWSDTGRLREVPR